MNTGIQLFQLQEIDSAIDKANRRISEIKERLVDETQVSLAKERIKQAESNFLHLKELFNSIDDDVKSKKIKKAQSESSLYGGTITNSKELQDLQKEIAFLSTHITNSEDELLNKYIDLEKAEGDLTEAKESLTIKLSESETSRALLKGEQNQQIRLIEGLLGKKESVIASIDSSVLATYESLRKSKNGIAVARLQEDSCGSCGASLTANQCQQARSQAKLFCCPSCGRILYGS
jgi:uncharacterized protein